MKKRSIAALAGAAVVLAGVTMLTGCTSDADQASSNLSQEAEDFKVNRRITFVNGITNDIMLTIEGFCSIETADSFAAGTLEVTCKEGEDAYTKDFLGLSDNVTFLVEQLDAIDVSLYHRKIILKPENILPEFDVQTGEQ